MIESKRNRYIRLLKSKSDLQFVELSFCAVKEIIELLEYTERPKGEWIEYDNSHCECPFCHEEWSYFDNEVEHFDFCPRCGADMRGEQDE